MVLQDLIEFVRYKKISGSLKIEVDNMTVDSRKVCRNSMFIAVKGTLTDGHQFIKTALEKGASVIVCEHEIDYNVSDRTFVYVENSSLALGELSAAFYQNPSYNLKLIGITGTNGKTTIATLLYRLMLSFGYKAGLISTVRNYINERPVESTHTTPDAITLNELLAQMVKEGCAYCFMEVSSHAVVQNRITGLHFTGGVFTNLTHDHLDYHGSFQAYRDAKKSFFDSLSETSFALSNADDANGKYMLQNTKGNTKFFSLKNPSEFKGTVLESTMDGLSMRIADEEVHFCLRGRFNASNLMAVYAVAVLLGHDSINVLKKMSALSPVDGRFDIIPNCKDIYAIVDYAHTPDAVENILDTIHEIRTQQERLIVVIGAGGNRDKTKRPEMGKIASRYADTLILTTDNPRNENPDDIIQDILKGIDTDKRQKTIVISDRKEAIRTACILAKKSDIIVVAGKGHENYQEIQGIKYDFDDRKIISEFLNI